jgi:hypothetical protein
MTTASQAGHEAAYDALRQVLVILYADVSADINIAVIRHEQILHTYMAIQILKDKSVQGLRL